VVAPRYLWPEASLTSRHTVDFTAHADISKFEKGEKVVFYQVNPLPNWGPAARAITIKKDTKATGSVQLDEGKRKAEEPTGEVEAKKSKVEEPVKTAEEVAEEEAMNV